MGSKRWCALAGAGTLFLLALCALAVIIVDPYEIYHTAWGYTPSYDSTVQVYSMAGIARNYIYDSAIVGSSVTENCRPSVYENALGGRFAKLSSNAGTARDHATVLDLAFRTHSLRRIVYGLDLFAYSVFYTNHKMNIPEYLYNTNPFDDVYYLFNKDVLLGAVPEALARINGKNEDVRDTMYAWDPANLPGAEKLIKKAKLKTPSETQDDDMERMLQFTQENFENNLLPYLRAHPDTEFDIFFPPYSILYWASAANKKNLDTLLAQKLLLIQFLLEEPNVRLFDFQNKAEWITDLDHYADNIHYLSSINNQMASAIASGECLVTDVTQAEADIKTLRSIAIDFCSEHSQTNDNEEQP